MKALAPRLFAEMVDWFDKDLLPSAGVIRMEDRITDTEYTVRAELPGLDPEKDIQLTVAHGMLTIHAERKEEAHTSHRTEFRYGVFERSVRLPENADESTLKASYRDGILEIAVSLTPATPAKRIAITTR